MPDRVNILMVDDQPQKLLAYEAMFTRDAERLRDARHRVNRLPLGSAALAVMHYVHVEALAREVQREHLGEVDVVVDEQNAWHGWGVRKPKVCRH